MEMKNIETAVVTVVVKMKNTQTTVITRNEDEKIYTEDEIVEMNILYKLLS